MLLENLDKNTINFERAKIYALHLYCTLKLPICGLLHFC